MRNKKILKHTLGLICIAGISAGAFSSTAYADFKNEKNAVRYYDTEGNATVSFTKIGDDWYYFNPLTKSMANAWVLSEDNTWYFFSNSEHNRGKLVKGFAKIGSCGYYFYENGENEGKLATNTNIAGVKIGANGKIPLSKLPKNISGVYLGNSETGSRWVDYNDSKYYINPTNNKVHTGWLYEAGKWYYFNHNIGEGYAKMLTGWQFIDGSDCYFYEDGILATSTVIDGRSIDEKGRAGVHILTDTTQNLSQKQNADAEQVKKIPKSIKSSTKRHIISSSDSESTGLSSFSAGSSSSAGAESIKSTAAANQGTESAALGGSDATSSATK